MRIHRGRYSPQTGKIGIGLGRTAPRGIDSRLEAGHEWRGTIQNPTSSVRSDKMYPAVKEVTPQEDFTLSVVFDNGERGILDMKPILEFGIFQRIKDYDKFRRVRVSFDTIEWDCGVDLDPEFVYKRCSAVVAA